MPGDERKIEHRLDMLGAVLAGEGVPMDGAFASAVRGRARARVWRRIGLGVGGVMAAAAALVIAFVPVRGGDVDGGGDGGGAAVAGATDVGRPTLGALSRLAQGEGDELPTFPSTGGSWVREAPLRRGTVLWGDVTEGILGSR